MPLKEPAQPKTPLLRATSQLSEEANSDAETSSSSEKTKSPASPVEKPSAAATALL